MQVVLLDVSSMDPCPPVPGWSDVVRANVALLASSLLEKP